MIIINKPVVLVPLFVVLALFLSSSALTTSAQAAPASFSASCSPLPIDWPHKPHKAKTKVVLYGSLSSKYFTLKKVYYRIHSYKALWGKNNYIEIAAKNKSWQSSKNLKNDNRVHKIKLPGSGIKFSRKSNLKVTATLDRKFAPDAVYGRCSKDINIPSYRPQPG